MLLVCLFLNAKAQKQDSTSFQVGIKSWMLPDFQFSPRLAGEFQYLYKNTRWAVGYQYYSLKKWTRNHSYLRGPYVEGEFLHMNLRERLRLGFPLRFYWVQDHYFEKRTDFNDTKTLTPGFLSLGANLHYRLNHNWEIGLEVGYLGMGFNVWDYDGFTYGMLDGTGISLYYNF